MTTRRIFAGGLAMAMIAPPAFAARGKRAPLPGGGEVLVPSPYEPVPEGDYRWRDTGGLIAYRHYRPMLSGTSECDGMIAIARKDAHEDFNSFVSASRSGLTTRWSYADESEGRWYGKPDERYPVERRMGPQGEELSGPLKVHMVGFFGVYDKPARFFAVDDGAGLRIAIGIFDSHGGEAKARRMADLIASSRVSP
jgi:hypothetical protein